MIVLILICSVILIGIYGYFDMMKQIKKMVDKVDM